MRSMLAIYNAHSPSSGLENYRTLPLFSQWSPHPAAQQHLPRFFTQEEGWNASHYSRV
jgi:hypothetical protein